MKDRIPFRPARSRSPACWSAGGRTVEDAEAAGVGFPSEVIERAWELLAEEGKAFKLPTKPAKYFFEG